MVFSPYELLDMAMPHTVVASFVWGLPFEACACQSCVGDGCKDCGWTGVPKVQEREVA